LPIAGKQNNAANQWVFQPLSIFWCQLQAGYIDDKGGMLCHVDSFL
jgi:hypothetical protein